MNHLTVFSVTTLLLSIIHAPAHATGSGNSDVIDLAVNPSTGVAYVTKIKENPKGELYEVDSSGVEVSRFQTSPHGRVMRQELELSPDGSLYVLVITPESARVEKLKKTGEIWESTAAFEILPEALRQPRALSLMPNGFSLEGFSKLAKDGGGLLNVLENPDHTFKTEVLTLSELPQAKPSDDPTPPPKPDRKFYSTTGAGFTAGLISGLGFAFRKFYASGFGFNIGAGALVQANGSVGTSIGLELLFTLAAKEKARFLLVTGASSFYTKDVYTDYVGPNADPVERIYSETSANFGLGLGIEWAPSGFKENGVTMALEVPLTVRFLTTSTTKGFKLNGLAPIPSFTLIYNFKNK